MPHSKDLSLWEKEIPKESLVALDKMPVAISVIRMEVDDTGNPVDFTFVYGNEALAKLEKIPLKKLLGSSFYKDNFPNMDKKWLEPYWETATKGVVRTINYYNPDINRFLEITCYQPAYGYCTCLLSDVSGKIYIQRELEDARHCVEMALRNSFDYMCFYDIEQHVLLNDNDIVPRIKNIPLRLPNMPQSLVEYGIIKPESLPLFQNIFTRLENGEEEITEEIEMDLTDDNEGLKWYKVNFLIYDSLIFNKKHILVMARNINNEVLYRHHIEQEAFTDNLTKLFNRKYAMARINAMPKDLGTKALFLFDLDDFKGINDTYGHQTGDDTLCFFANVLKEAFRESDIVFRLGGDEFAAFVCGNGTTFVEEICERILIATGSQKQFPFPIRCSIGVGMTADPSQEYSEFYRVADKALYSAKKAGKNIWRIEMLPKVGEDKK